MALSACKHSLLHPAALSDTHACAWCVGQRQPGPRQPPLLHKDTPEHCKQQQYLRVQQVVQAHAPANKGKGHCPIVQMCGVSCQHGRHHVCQLFVLTWACS